jgi:hypothetical protein
MSASYASSTEARRNFKAVLDAAVAGGMVMVHRESATAAVLDAKRLRHFLASVIPARARVVPEAGGFSVMGEGLPVAGDGNTLDEAMQEMVSALRDYAMDWQDWGLKDAPNHRDNWGLVQLISLSSDEELREWLDGSR